MKKFASLIPVLILSIFFSWTASAQEVSEEYNYNSLRPIRKSDMMYKNTLWWRMDMREKQNEAFFAEDNQVTQIIIDAVKAGVLRPFESDELNTRMSLTQFLENLKVPGAGEGESEIDWPSDDPWPSDEGSDPWIDGETIEGSGDGDGLATDTESEEFFAKQIPILEIKTNLIYDKKRSRMYTQIESISLIIPGDNYTSGIEKVLATFSYKELVENVFVDNPNASWYNAQNTIEHRNLADAFDLSLYAARIIKYANPKDAYIEDIYNGDLKLSLAKSQAYQHKLLEYEANTWSN